LHLGAVLGDVTNLENEKRCMKLLHHGCRDEKSVCSGDPETITCSSMMRATLFWQATVAKVAIRAGVAPVGLFGDTKTISFVLYPIRVWQASTEGVHSLHVF